MILVTLRQCPTILNLIKRTTLVSFYRNTSLCGIISLNRSHLEFRWPHKSMATGGDNTVTSKYQNRLAYERSPYLLQHATNPVEWYPWGNEAFEKARQEDKLIFLSVGYSTCHWCHVMERESFENEEIAKVMNEHFVNIKVDREERPDVDKIYMTFVQATSGHGGWPMSVFLTPALQPIMGGTYFPPEDQWHRPGFRTMLLRMVQQWKDNRQKFAESGAKVIDVLRKTTTLDIPLAMSSLATSVPSPDCWEKCLEQLSQSFEPQFGGFGLAPKFPQPVNFNFLFHVYARDTNSEAGKKALDMCTHTLKMMAKGGIHDHVAQGFARYSTDERWHVPHFEKMLYDQAQLAVAYCTAYLATGDEFYADIVRDILQYVGRDLGDKSGGFYSAEDADSYPTHDAKHKKEGAFCVWTYDDVQRLLNRTVEESNFTLADIFCYHYDVKPQGNVNPNQDPHNELKYQNVLIVSGSEEQTAEKYGLGLPATQAALEEGRRILFEVRQKRPRPHLDDKMLTAWNGLMISGYAKAGQVLKDTAYVERAIKAANFVKKHLYNPTAETLLRSCYRGSDGNVVQISSPISGFVDDYAFLIRGLLDLYEACFDPTFVEWAETLQDQQDRLFWDEEGAGYFTSPASDPSILIRLKEGLITDGLPLREQFRRWFVAQATTMLGFLSSTLFIDETTFTRGSIVNLHNTRLWVMQNPRGMVAANHQHQFSFNVWAEIIGDRLVGPVVLPQRLTGEASLHFLRVSQPPLVGKRCLWWNERLCGCYMVVLQLTSALPCEVSSMSSLVDRLDEVVKLHGPRGRQISTLRISTCGDT